MPLRAEPSHRAEQVNELLFGERAEVLEINDREWARVRCEWDGYEGWCRAGQLSFISHKEYRKAPKYLTAKHSDKIIFEQGEQWLPLGCDLFRLKGGKMLAGSGIGKFKGKKSEIKKLSPDCNHIKDAVLQYLHAPYLWGGRTIAGIDCSGLTQMAFKLCGQSIPRNAADQATEGKTIDFLQNAECGDLAGLYKKMKK